MGDFLAADDEINVWTSFGGVFYSSCGVVGGSSDDG